ncbi:MAG: hypothetical protein ACYDCL_00035 [Myxococcales bacterium]
MGQRLLSLVFVVGAVAGVGVIGLWASRSRALDQADVPEATCANVKVKKLKTGKVTTDIDTPGELKVKPLKVGKIDTASVDAADVVSKAEKVPKVTLEGIPELPKKPDPEDQALIDEAAQKAEADQGGPGGGQSQMAEQRAEVEASTSADQKALDQGRDPASTRNLDQEVRQRIQEDYARAADGGSLEKPPEEAQPAAPAPPAEALPEVLEPPKEEPSEDGSEGAGQVIDVSQAPQTP